MRRRFLSALCLFLSASFPSFALNATISQKLLWDSSPPFATGSRPETDPALEAFVPPHGNGTAVIVCPGGGYGTLMLDYEGEAPARWLNSLGITAFVLRYRHAPEYRYPVPLLDMERAIRFMRFHSNDYHIRAGRIGVLGFSAGGHLAALAAEQIAGARVKPRDAIDKVSSRPDFILLGYPVISMEKPLVNEWVATNLLGADAPQTLRDRPSAERHVTPGMPPVFIFLTGDDRLVEPQNSLLFYKALQEAHVPSELHLYPHGPHGFGLADGAHPICPSLPHGKARLCAGCGRSGYLMRLT